MRLLQHCGMPAGDVDFIHGDGKVVGGILKDAPARSSLFTGSQAVAEHLVVDLKGKVRHSSANHCMALHRCHALATLCRVQRLTVLPGGWPGVNSMTRAQHNRMVFAALQGALLWQSTCSMNSRSVPAACS